MQEVTYFGKGRILNPISVRDHLVVVREALVTLCQDLLALVGIGSIATNPIVDSRETGEGKSRGRHCWYGWVMG